VYKRNQIEEATSWILERRESGPSTILRTRLKRALEIDRELKRSVQSKDPFKANYAFFTRDAEGTGKEVWHSAYEAFAILTSLRLMAHNWEQKVSVEILRRIRPVLEPEHSRILRQDPILLFDGRRSRKNTRPPDLSVNNSDPVFLILAAPANRPSKVDLSSFPFAIVRGIEETFRWVSDNKEALGSYALFELVESVHFLANRLARVEPRARGR
jgi:hypothetical protein